MDGWQIVPSNRNFLLKKKSAFHGHVEQEEEGEEEEEEGEREVLYVPNSIRTYYTCLHIYEGSERSEGEELYTLEENGIEVTVALSYLYLLLLSVDVVEDGCLFCLPVSVFTFMLSCLSQLQVLRSLVMTYPMQCRDTLLPHAHITHTQSINPFSFFSTVCCQLTQACLLLCTLLYVHSDTLADLDDVNIPPIVTQG
jgi:hypothetical protein